MRQFYIIVLLCCCGAVARAQVNNQRCRWVRPTPLRAFPDTLTPAPQTLRLPGLPDSLRAHVRYDATAHRLRFDSTVAWPDSVQLCYRVLPYRLGQTHFRRDPNQYDSSRYFRETARLNLPVGSREELFSTTGIEKNGSISRGISFGNRQSVFVNSALNLQLEGKLTEDISVTAVITDQSVPFQPEGNTQQLQEFDQVYIRLDHQYASLLAGDVVMESQPSAFLKYYKNTQGGQLTARYPVGESAATTRVGVAAAKGKFSSQVVPVIEGVLGPYRLTGPNGETFIIILANSERVYLDGRLLTRGFNRDYVIDYNQAEITLTSEVLITQYSRLRVDFEYAERNYARTILQASHYHEAGRFNAFFSHYQESDNPNNPFNITLDTADRRVLQQIGDDLSRAVVGGAQPVPFSEDEILYVRRDTTEADGTPTTIFLRTFGETDELLRVAFSDVGPGNGAYEQVLEATNGRAYRWVGAGNGRYAPLRRIPTPNLRRVTTAGASYDLSETAKVYVEGALSGFDPNRFSTLDADDNQGTALKVGFANTGQEVGWEALDGTALGGYRWLATLDYEFLHRHFRAIDRFRDIEFDRDWSAENPGDTVLADDHLLTASMGLVKDADHRLAYRLSWRQKGPVVNGTQQQFEAAQRLWRFQLRADGFLLRNRRPDLHSDWRRASADLSYRRGPLVPGYIFRIDQNQVNAAETDSVVTSAMYFTEHQWYVRTADSARWQLNASYSLRGDETPQQGEIQPFTFARTAQIAAGTRFGQQQLRLVSTYRDLDYETEALRNLDEETVQGRLDWTATLLDRHVRSELSYAVASGRELRREFQFLPAPVPGQGTHQYIGPPDDPAARQDIRNYVEAIRPEDRNFIKVFVPTNEYVRAFTNNLNYRLNLTAPRGWRQRQGLLNVLSRFSSVSSWSVDRRLTAEELRYRFSPVGEVPDSSLIATQQALRATLFFNRTNPRYGLDFNVAQLRQKTLLTSGFEDRGSDEYRLNTRFNFWQVFNLKTAGLVRERLNRSDVFDNRNYALLSRELETELAYQPSGQFRLGGLYELAQRRNRTGPETATLHTAGLNLRWTKVGTHTVDANVRYISIAYVGETNTPLSYEILEALQPGDNYTWTVNWQQRLINGLQLTLSYEGRRSENVPVVHLGRMQVSALF